MLIKNLSIIVLFHFVILFKIDDREIRRAYGYMIDR